MARFYSARELARAHGVSASTANRRWDAFPSGVDEQGRRFVEVPDEAALLRYPRRKHPPLTLLDAGAPPYGGSPADRLDDPLVAALLRELEARSRQIDQLIKLVEQRLSDAPGGP